MSWKGIKYILKMVSEENLIMSLPHQNSVSISCLPSYIPNPECLIHSTILTAAIHKTKSLSILNFMYPYIVQISKCKSTGNECSPFERYESVWGKRDISPLILNLSTR
jgi:hypothetical protein